MYKVELDVGAWILGRLHARSPILSDFLPISGPPFPLPRRGGVDPGYTVPSTLRFADTPEAPGSQATGRPGLLLLQQLQGSGKSPNKGNSFGRLREAAQAQAWVSLAPSAQRGGCVFTRPRSVCRPHANGNAGHPLSDGVPFPCLRQLRSGAWTAGTESRSMWSRHP